MHCPFCNAADTKVIDSRLSGVGDQVRRRRECLICKERFTTYEQVVLDLPRVIKSDGTREPFDGAKLRGGMLRALEKRPVSSTQVETAISSISRKLMANGESEVSARFVGDLVMDELKQIDQVAYVRFASVYRDFKDVAEFREAIEKLETQPTPEENRMQLTLLGEPEMLDEKPKARKKGRKR